MDRSQKYRKYGSSPYGRRPRLHQEWMAYDAPINVERISQSGLRCFGLRIQLSRSSVMQELRRRAEVRSGIITLLSCNLQVLVA
jgi:hypothetical protein